MEPLLLLAWLAGVAGRRGWPAGRQAGWLADWQAGWFLVCEMAGWLAGWVLGL